MPTNGKKKSVQVKTGTTVQMERDLHRMARAVSAIRGRRMAVYLDSLLRPLVEREYRELVREEA